jgi:RNA polymerase sigma-70 factor (ECF subfamily)
LAYIRSIVRDSHLAEDIFQDVSIVALRKREEIIDETHFGAWVRRTARLEAMNVLRREQKRRVAPPAAVLDLLDNHWDNRDLEVARQRSEWLGECLDRLSDRASQLVRWRYVDGASPGQLAERLGRPINTIYVALTRIHRTLAECVRRKAAAERMV